MLIVDEESGNSFGERAYALVLDPETLALAKPGAAGSSRRRGRRREPARQGRGRGTRGRDRPPATSEFSGSWSLTALLAKGEDGAFHSMEEIAGTGAQAIAGALPIAEQVLMGVVQHRTDSGGQVRAVEADHGGQVFLFDLDLPEAAFDLTALR